MKRRDFLAALGMATAVSTLPLDVLESYVKFGEEDLQLMADFALRELKRELPLRQYKVINLSQIVTQNGIDLRWELRNENAIELTDRIIRPACHLLAKQCELQKITGFAPLPLPQFANVDDKAFSTDESGVFVRLLKQYDLQRDSIDLRLDIAVA